MNAKQAVTPAERAGRGLKVARVAAGLTQEELGVAFKMTRSAVAQWETGRLIPNDRARRLIWARLNYRYPDVEHGETTTVTPPPAGDVDDALRTTVTNLQPTTVVFADRLLKGFLSIIDPQRSVGEVLTELEHRRRGRPPTPKPKRPR